LPARRSFVLLNKIDLVEDSTKLGKLQAAFDRLGVRSIMLSALTGEGIEPLKELIGRTLAEMGEPPAGEE
jgi:50S ribosomal subunit-associated GTPase HflX